MLVLPDSSQPGWCRVSPTIDIHRLPGLLLFKKDNLGMRVVVDIADEGITGAKALDGLLENDLSAGRLEGIKIDRAHGVVIGVVASDQDLAFAVEVEVG